MKCCGNCRHHSAYKYPHVVFCFDKFEGDEKSVKNIFDVCDDWESKEQECFCLQDAEQAARHSASV